MREKAMVKVFDLTTETQAVLDALRKLREKKLKFLGKVKIGTKIRLKRSLVAGGHIWEGEFLGVYPDEDVDHYFVSIRGQRSLPNRLGSIPAIKNYDLDTIEKIEKI